MRTATTLSQRKNNKTTTTTKQQQHQYTTSSESKSKSTTTFMTPILITTATQLLEQVHHEAKLWMQQREGVMKVESQERQVLEQLLCVTARLQRVRRNKHVVLQQLKHCVLVFGYHPSLRRRWMQEIRTRALKRLQLHQQHALLVQELLQSQLDADSPDIKWMRDRLQMAFLQECRKQLGAFGIRPSQRRALMKEIRERGQERARVKHKYGFILQQLMKQTQAFGSQPARRKQLMNEIRCCASERASRQARQNATRRRLLQEIRKYTSTRHLQSQARTTFLNEIHREASHRHLVRSLHDDFVRDLKLHYHELHRHMNHDHRRLQRTNSTESAAA
jgi:hypothetical protein